MTCEWANFFPPIANCHPSEAMLRAVTEGMRGRVRDSVGALRGVFANPDLRRLQLAYATSMTGWWVFFIALPVYTYEADGAVAVGLVGGLRLGVAAIAAPFAALLGDRHDRALVMLGSDLVRAVGARASRRSRRSRTRRRSSSTCWRWSSRWRRRPSTRRRRAPAHPRAHARRADRRERHVGDDRQPLGLRGPGGGGLLIAVVGVDRSSA